MRLSLSGSLAAAVLLLIGTSAAAVPQFTPTATSRLHTLGSGQPGAEWNTGGLLANGEIDYDSGTGRLTIEAELDVLNYYDPGTACPTDVGSNCAFNYGTNLDITLEADLHSIDVTPLGGGDALIEINFESTGGTDLTLVDPTDLSTLLTAEWQAGTFASTVTTGLTVSAFYLGGSVFGDPQVTGVFGDMAGSYASLFGPLSGNFGLSISEAFDFSPSIDAIAATIIGTGSLPDFTAEGEGQVFRTETGQFVPEPATWLLMVTSAAGLFLAGRRR